MDDRSYDHRRTTSHRSRADVERARAEWTVADPSVYAYLLGIYLGDGNIVYKPPRTWTLRVSCDRAYVGIRSEVRAAMEACFPGSQARERPYAREAAQLVSVTHPAIGLAFPQHGPGHKHLRPIALADWQLAVTQRVPGPLIRGLIHSDGCRVTNRFTTQLPSGRRAEYSYTRYFFSNLSEDIREIFRAHCELLGVRVTPSNPRNLSVSSRRSVAILDRIVGPKA